MAIGESTAMRFDHPAAVAASAELADLERRVDEAVAIVRASEAAIMTVGAAAFDAAEQARRAAGLAERASAAMLGGSPLLPPEPAIGEIRVSAAAPAAEPENGHMHDFNRRADRVVARLRALGAPVS